MHNFKCLFNIQSLKHVNAAAQKKVNLHTDILSLSEIQRAIQQTIVTKEQKFIDKINSGQVDGRLWKEIKQKYIHHDDAVKIIKSLSNTFSADNHEQESTELTKFDKIKKHNEIVKQDVYDYFIAYFTKRYERLSFKQIAVILENYAYVNRFDQQFFRFLENEIYDRLENDTEIVHYQDVEKIVWAYQYCQYGSAMLYNRLASVIKVAQHEINPLKLSYYAYLYTKCPENVNGGFGLFKVAEARVLDRIRDYEFKDCLKLAKYYLNQNIGSNEFQQLIEQKLSDQFPSNLQPAELVKLCKYTSKYYFKYNDKALYHQIEGACIELIAHVNDSQFAEIMWAFLRSRKGNHVIYTKLEEQLYIRSPMLTFRQLTLLFLNSAQNTETFKISKCLQKLINKYITKESPSKIKKVYLVYIFIASLKSRLHTAITFNEDDFKQLSTSMKMSLLATLQSALLSTTNLRMLQQLVDNLQQSELERNDQVMLKYTELVFHRIVKQSKLSPLIDQTIHKQIFHQALLLDPTNESLHNALTMLHQQHGDQLRFCFKQDHWVIISWVLLSQHLLNKERIINTNIIQQACLGIQELDINMIHNLDKYVQALWMMILIKELNPKYGHQKLRLTKQKLIDFSKSNAILNNTLDEELIGISQMLETSLKQQFEEFNIVPIENHLINNMFDQSNYQLIQIANISELDNQALKIALIVLKDQDIDVDSTQNIQLSIGQEDQNIICKINTQYLIQKLILEEVFEFRVDFIHQSSFNRMSQLEQIEYFKNVFSLESLESETEQSLKQPKYKQMKFNEKLNLKQKSEYESDILEDDELL